MGLHSTEDSCSPVISDVRIVLVGKTGSGKSETGNTILGFKAFKAELSPSSVTKICNKEIGHFNDRTVSVIDTPGIFDTSTDEAELKKEMENCVMLSVPGPHVFLLVISVAVRFTDEETKAVQWIKDNFGEEASKYTMVLFTRGDMLKGKSIEEFVQQSPVLQKLVRACNGYAVLDNTCKGNRTQVSDLFENIDKIVHLNGNHYTSTIYEEAQRKLQNGIWWGKMGDRLIAASNYMLVGAAGLTMGAAPAAAAAAEELAVVATVRSAVMFVGAGAAQLIGRWMKPKPKP